MTSSQRKILRELPNHNISTIKIKKDPTLRLRKQLIRLAFLF